MENETIEIGLPPILNGARKQKSEQKKNCRDCIHFEIICGDPACNWCEMTLEEDEFEEYCRAFVKKNNAGE